MDCSLPVSSIHGIFQARVLEWGAIAFSLTKTTGDERDMLIKYNVVFWIGSCNRKRILVEKLVKPK